MNNLQEMMQIVLDEVKKNNITIVKWSRETGGRAEEGRLIKIPIPIDNYTIGVCFHEIGHIVLKHFDAKVRKRGYIEEYEAEQFAIQKLKHYGYYSKKYEYRAIQYVLYKIAQSKNKGLDIREVPKEIVKWTNLKINKWKKAKFVYIEMEDDVKKKSDIKVKFKKRK